MDDDDDVMLISPPLLLGFWLGSSSPFASLSLDSPASRSISTTCANVAAACRRSRHPLGAFVSLPTDRPRCPPTEPLAWPDCCSVYDVVCCYCWHPACSDQANSIQLLSWNSCCCRHLASVCPCWLCPACRRSNPASSYRYFSFPGCHHLPWRRRHRCCRPWTHAISGERKQHQVCCF